MMDREIYCRLVDHLNLPISAIPHFQAIAKRFEVSADTVYSIYHQEITARILKQHHLLRHAGARYARRYLKGSDLLQLCYEVDLPPCTVIRVIIERLPLGIQSNKLTSLLRRPELLPSLVQHEAWQQHCASSGSDSSTLPEVLSRLQREIELCIDCDGCGSPAADLSRHNAGREHEAKLYACLNNAGIAYWTEDDLRDKGFHKTPDAKLQVPIAIQGRIVNWIDSKATFGDDKTHKDQALAQYQKYVNRFGPGMVIYWHGFIADLAQLPGGEDVLLLDDFPQAADVVTLPRLPLHLGLASPPAPTPQPGLLPCSMDRGVGAAAARAEGGHGEGSAAQHAQRRTAC